MKMNLAGSALAVLLFLGSFAPQSLAASPSIPGLRLSVAPIVDVGRHPTFTLTARSWPRSSTVTLRVLAPHHGFSGPVPWAPRCGCFRLSVFLANRIHPLESATAWATVHVPHGSVTTSTGFQIRGLAPNGRTYAPGGKPSLLSWVSDESPTSGEDEHYCAWVHASDAIGLAGVRVRFVVHLPGGNQQLNAGRTNSNGVACAHHSIGSPPHNVKIVVDTYAASLHARLTFELGT